MKDIFKVIVVFFVLFFISFFLLNFENLFWKERVKVENVTDGDTILLSDGRILRLIGINAPEKGDYYYEEAKDYLCSLLCKKYVVIEYEMLKRDEYGRLRGYVWLNNELINLKMIENGYAHTYFIDGTKFKDMFLNAEIEAMNKKIGIWNSKFGCIVVHSFNWNAVGDDCENANDEFIVFRNICNYTISLGGYRLKDADANFFTFPSVSLKPNGYITLHSGQGDNNETNLFWNSNKSCPAVWNNDGDKLFLRDPNGTLVLYYEY